MTGAELLSRLRMQLTLLGMAPQLDEALQLSLDTAHRKFFSLLGGIPDMLEVDYLAGDAEVEIPSYVLKIKSVQRNSDGADVEVVNRAETRTRGISKMLRESGQVRFLVIGTQVGVGQLAYIPTEADTLVMDVERLPMKAFSLTTTPPDMREEWQLALVHGACSDITSLSSDPGIRARSQDFAVRFAQEVEQAKKHLSRSKSKQTRVVRYGGF